MTNDLRELYLKILRDGFLPYIKESSDGNYIIELIHPSNYSIKTSVFLLNNDFYNSIKDSIDDDGIIPTPFFKKFQNKPNNRLFPIRETIGIGVINPRGLLKGEIKTDKI